MSLYLCSFCNGIIKKTPNKKVEIWYCKPSTDLRKLFEKIKKVDNDTILSYHDEVSENLLPSLIKILHFSLEKKEQNARYIIKISYDASNIINGVNGSEVVEMHNFVTDHPHNHYF
jgi:hypothetical protein